MTPRTQWGLEFSPTWAGAVTYAHKLDASHVMLGLGWGFAWKLNNHSYDRNVWEVLHLEALARYQPAASFQGELGLSVASSAPTDDTSERRVFVGLCSSALVGYRFLFVGPQARVGFLDSEFGWIANAAIRGILPIGR